MKKMINTQGLSYGRHCAENLSKSLEEHVNPRLEHSFLQNLGEEVHTKAALWFDVVGGEVKIIVLDYTIDNPTPERLSLFRDFCDMFFCLQGFVVNDEDGHVCFMASDNYDKGCLIHALDMLTVSLESVICVVDEEKLAYDAVYTPSGSTIVRVPNVPKYRIEEGTQWIAPNALQNCPRLRFLDIPYGMINHREMIDMFAPKVKYKEWTTLYDGTLPEEDEECDDDDVEDFYVDEYQVAYSKDGKKLLFARVGFREAHYEVPDGVEEIDDCAFCGCHTYVELVIPRSVRRIGDLLFGNGGHIQVRDAS